VANGEALTIFVISQAETQVAFELDEDLRGSRNTVIGTTNQVAGEIGLDLADLSSAQVGVIRVNVRTLVTDNDLRNRAISNQILDTGEYEFISFTPTSIEALTGRAGIGHSLSFTILGDLTIRDITRPVAFLVAAQADSESQISGRATAVVNRADYELNIPSVRNVANVDEEVKLSIDFVARAP
jgi:polyisoprenoid-binding protein YceI